MAADLGVGLAGAIVGGGVGAGVGHVVNRQVIKRGKNELARQLKTKEYADIEMGRISRQALMEVNDIRLKEGVEMARDNTLWIPKDRVEHIYERRVRDGKMHPDHIAGVVSDLVKAKKVTVKAGNKIENQELSYIPKGATSGRVGYVSVFKDEKRIPSFIERISGVRLDERLGLVTAMKKKVKKLK